MSQQNASSKKKLGQFYTTNYKYIMQNMFIPPDTIHIIEPFAGNGDLLEFVKGSVREYTLHCFDIDPKKDFIIKRDTLMNPPCFDGVFVITNPPYLARNKSENKEIFDKYDSNDLYKCFIQILIESECQGGILIVPLNVFCSIRKNDVDIRKKFLEKYRIQTINIFEEQVFQDTSYTICCFQYQRFHNGSSGEPETLGFIYPENKKIVFQLNAENNYTIGGEIYNLPQYSIYKIDRATKLMKETTYFTHILAKCIDDNIDHKIGLSIISDKDVEKYIDKTPNLSSRSYALIVVEPSIDYEQQKKLVDDFNYFINENREKYNSLFLTNYRESNTIARKRISFGLVYTICNYLLGSNNG